jgi:hypothetical protein
MRLVGLFTFSLGGCALADALSGGGSAAGDSDADADADTDTDTDADTDSGTGTDTGTGTGTGTGSDTGSDTDTGPSCFERDEKNCEVQGDPSECDAENRYPDYPKGVCDPTDDCGCPDGEHCYPDGAASECATAGDVAAGERCLADTACEPGHFCLTSRLFGDPGDACARACDDACDCAPDEACVGFRPPVCHRVEMCNPADPDACPLGEGCVYGQDIDGDARFTTCMPAAGDLEEGSPCAFVNECTTGLMCVGRRDLGPGTWCSLPCDPGITDCGEGRFCRNIASLGTCPFALHVCEAE